jgi:hypothetical protein
MMQGVHLRRRTVSHETILAIPSWDIFVGKRKKSVTGILSRDTRIQTGGFVPIVYDDSGSLFFCQ